MSDESGSAIEFLDVRYRINGKTVLSAVNLAVQHGETLVLLGRSGSGKTTCLKMINRLLSPNAGEVHVEGTSVRQWDAIKLRRGIGYAIQEVGLFPHYTVRQNVSVVPKLQGWEQSRIDQRVQQVLQLVGLPAAEFAHRYPQQLSGGQRQRVGLARALGANPSILLMDEPFGALDPITRSELQMEFKKLQQELSKTIVFVTHDVGEALLLASRIAVLEDGQLCGIHTAEEFLRSQNPLAKAYADIFRAGQAMFRN